MRFTQFIYDENEGMVLRSGTSINCLKHSQLYKDTHDLLKGKCQDDKLHSWYCAPCKRLFNLLDFLETHHKEIKGVETKIHGKGNKGLIALHEVVKNKLKEFIEWTEKVDVGTCYCDDIDRRYGGNIYDNVCHMQDLAEERNYYNAANYKGYGKERELYRIYHLNFFVRVEVDDEVFIDRDFKKIKEELQHWYKYFSTVHHSVVLDCRQALSTHPRIKINSDCISDILSFL